MKTNAKSIADYILCYFHERGDDISNLKLQKLIYYSQGWFLGLHEEPLFDDILEAWKRGPVQPHLYRQFKKYKFHPIDDDPACPDFKDQRIIPLVDYVLDKYGSYSAIDLEKKTHQEPPWINARQGLKLEEDSKARISHDSMKNFFKEEAKKEENEEKRDLIILSDLCFKKALQTEQCGDI